MVRSVSRSRAHALALALSSILFALPGSSAAAIATTYEARLLRDDLSALQVPSSFARLGEVLFFSAVDDPDGYNQELWRTDGTAAGTFRIADVYPGNYGQIGNVVRVGGVILFSAEHPDYGLEWWRTDGTADGTVLVRDVRPGFYGGAPGTPMVQDDDPFVVMNDILYWVGNDGTNGAELWRTDGTAAGTLRLTEMTPNDQAPRRLTVAGDRLFFTADDGVHGEEVWVTDGTAAGTQMLADVAPGDAYNPYPPTELTAVGSLLFFQGSDRTHRELWVSDGTPAGTTLLSVGRPAQGAAYVDNLIEAGGRLYLNASEPEGSRLWTSDGTQAGTLALPVLNAGFTHPNAPVVAVGDRVFFPARTADGGAMELFMSDGTPGGTSAVATLAPAGSAVLYPEAGFAWDQRLWFVFDDQVNGSELWVSDGTDAGTHVFRDLNPGVAGSTPWLLAPVPGGLLFGADDGVHGREPWFTDGTPEGTTLVTDVRTGPFSCCSAFYTSPRKPPERSIGVAGDLVVFGAYDDVGTRVYAISPVAPQAAMPSLSISGDQVLEDAGPLTFEIALSEPSAGDVEVQASTEPITAEADVDYIAPVGTVVLAAGETTATLQVPVNDDDLDEPNETLRVRLSEPAGATIAGATATGTIVDDDAPPTVSVGSAATIEGRSGSRAMTFDVTLSAVSGRTIRVDYATADGSARAPSDYTRSDGTLIFAPGETNATVSVAARGDELDEPDERFTISLSSPVNVTLATGLGRGTIFDDDAPPTLRIGDRGAPEGDRGSTQARFLVRLGAPSGRTVSASWRTVARSAKAGSDFRSDRGTVRIAAGRTRAVITVLILGDRRRERTEVFEVRLSRVAGARIRDAIARGVIRDDD